MVLYATSCCCSANIVNIKCSMAPCRFLRLWEIRILRMYDLRKDTMGTGKLCLQAVCRKRKQNLDVIYLWLFCVIVYFCQWRSYHKLWKHCKISNLWHKAQGPLPLCSLAITVLYSVCVFIYTVVTTSHIHCFIALVRRWIW